MAPSLHKPPISPIYWPGPENKQTRQNMPAICSLQKEQPSPPAKRIRLRDDTVSVSPGLPNPVADPQLIFYGNVNLIPSAGLDYNERVQENSTVEQPKVGISVVQADGTKDPLQGRQHLQQNNDPNNPVASFRSINSVHKRRDNYNTCHLCNKTFESSYKLKRHMYAHSTEKPFACGICGRDFSTGSRLNEHLRSHSVAAFPCPLCINAFQNPIDRLIHVLTQACTLGHRHLHKTDQGWHCLLCGDDMGFTNREHAEYHVRKHEHELGKGMFCPVCNQNFYGEKANILVRHVKKKHRDYIESLVFLNGQVI